MDKLRGIYINLRIVAMLMVLSLPANAQVIQKVVATVPAGNDPSAAGVNITTSKVYVCNINGNSVTVFDGLSGVVTATIPTGIRSEEHTSELQSRLHLV